MQNQNETMEYTLEDQAQDLSVITAFETAAYVQVQEPVFRAKTHEELYAQIKTDQVTILDPTINGQNAKEKLSEVYGETRYQNYVLDLRYQKLKQKNPERIHQGISELKSQNLGSSEFTEAAYQSRLISPLEYKRNIWIDGQSKAFKKGLQQKIVTILYKNKYKENNEFIQITLNRILERIVPELLLSCSDSTNFDEYLNDVFAKVGHLLEPIIENTYEGTKNPNTILKTLDTYFAKVMYPGYQIEFRVGYGGSEDEINVRSCSYIIPALVEMQKFVDIGIQPPNLVICHGGELAISCNDMDRDKVDENKEQIFKITTAFIQKFYPDLLQFVRYTEFEKDEVESQRMLERIEQIKQLTTQLNVIRKTIGDTLRITFPDLSDEDLDSIISQGKNAKKSVHPIIDHMESQLPETAQLRETAQRLFKVNNSVKALLRLGNHHGCYADERTYKYIAAHPDEKTFGDIQTFEHNHRVHSVMKFGGTGENNFNILEHWLADNNVQPDTYRPNTTFGLPALPVYRELIFGGKPPVYYSSGQYEVSVNQAQAYENWEQILRHYKMYIPECYRDVTMLPEEYFDFLIQNANANQ